MLLLCLTAGAARAERAWRGDAPLAATLLAQVAPRNEAISRASQQVDAGDFEDAVKTLQRGLEQPELTDEQLVELYRLLGLAHLYLGNEDKARDAFEKLLQARPDYELPRSAPPKVRAIYARLKDDIRSRRVRPVTLKLEAIGDVPGGAAVTVLARIEDLALGARAKLYFRRAGGPSFSSVDFSRERGSKVEQRAVIPAFEVPSEDATWDMEYYVEVADAAQRRLAGRGDAFNPLSFRVLAPAVAAAPPQAPRVEARPWYANPWLWVGIGVGAAATTTGVVLLATSRQSATLPITIQIEGTP
jgi:tetratricopeptide (TPR) repeat protein